MTLKLSDGTTLKTMAVVTKILRYEDYDQYGDPIYQVFSNNVVRVTGVPEELRGTSIVPGTKPAPSSVEVG